MRLSYSLPALLLALSAGAAAASAEPPNACDLLKTDEASSLLGSPVKPMVPKSIMCMYMTVDGASGMTAAVLPLDDAKTASAGLDKMLSNRAPKGLFEPVVGVGERAYFINVDNGDFVLCALTGKYVLTLQLPAKIGTLTPARKTAMIADIKKMISRL